MKTCPNCGHKDNQYWRHSRFDFNTDYMETEEFQREYPEFWEKVKGKKNKEPVDIGFDTVIYLRGAASHYVYRVDRGDFNVPGERVGHDRKKETPNQVKLLED